MIIELCLAGEVHHYRRLVERHQRGLIGLAYRLLGNRADAEEVAQQSFVDAFDALRDFNPTYRFSSWLYRITINNCKDRQKSKRGKEQPLDAAEVSQDDAVFAGGVPDPERALTMRETAARVKKALDRLPLKYRTVVILKDMQGLSYDEIRSILGLPLTTLKIRVVRGRKRLKELLGPEGESA
jgi:RNA polymerase sigma-70 factor (ECF subfamily)